MAEVLRKKAGLSAALNTPGSPPPPPIFPNKPPNQFMFLRGGPYRHTLLVFKGNMGGLSK